MWLLQIIIYNITTTSNNDNYNDNCNDDADYNYEGGTLGDASCCRGCSRKTGKSPEQRD